MTSRGGARTQAQGWVTPGACLPHRTSCTDRGAVGGERGSVWWQGLTLNAASPAVLLADRFKYFKNELFLL